MNSTLALLLSLYIGFGLFFTLVAFNWHNWKPRVQYAPLRTAFAGVAAVLTWPFWVACVLYTERVSNG